MFAVSAPPGPPGGYQHLRWAWVLGPGLGGGLRGHSPW